jgi:hypothetical protein
LFYDINQNGWDGTCNGGVCQNHLSTHQKDAIVNELYIELAAALYRATGDQGYLDGSGTTPSGQAFKKGGNYNSGAEGAWDWLMNSGMVEPVSTWYAVSMARAVGRVARELKGVRDQVPARIVELQAEPGAANQADLYWRDEGIGRILEVKYYEGRVSDYDRRRQRRAARSAYSPLRGQLSLFGDGPESGEEPDGD